MLDILEYMLMLVYWIVSLIIFLMIFRKEQLSTIMYTIANTLFTVVPNDITDINDPNYTGGVNYIFTPFKLFY